MLAALSGSAFAQWVVVTGWAYATFLTGHGLGMAGVVGITLMIGLRVLGFPKQVPLAYYAKTIPFGIGAFILNAATGTALFVADAETLSKNPSFLVKIASIVVGLIVLTLLYKGPIKGAIKLREAGGGDYQPTGYDKTLAVLAILIWLLAVIVSGRLIAYLASDNF